MSNVDGNISDMFFNTDLSHCKIKNSSNGMFMGFDENKLKAEAEVFLGYLKRIRVPVPTVDELIADFYSRM